jgi:hypothetical protein
MREQGEGRNPGRLLGLVCFVCFSVLDPQHVDGSQEHCGSIREKGCPAF